MTMQEVSTAQEFMSLVAKMRSLQKQYFKSRSFDILHQSKAAELAVDKAIQEFTATSKQQSLFNESPYSTESPF